MSPEGHGVLNFRLLNNYGNINLNIDPFQQSQPITMSERFRFMTSWYYSDVIMSAMASQIACISIVCSTVYPGAYQRKHQSSVSLAFVRGINRWPVDSPHKGPVARKMVLFDDVIIICWNKCGSCYQFAENVSIWWRHHGYTLFVLFYVYRSLPGVLYLLILWTDYLTKSRHINVTWVQVDRPFLSLIWDIFIRRINLSLNEHDQFCRLQNVNLLTYDQQKLFYGHSDSKQH